eukprot:1151444-Pelagomonas_calceolata.AAC.6
MRLWLCDEKPLYGSDPGDLCGHQCARAWIRRRLRGCVRLARPGLPDRDDVLRRTGKGRWGIGRRVLCWGWTLVFPLCSANCHACPEDDMMVCLRRWQRGAGMAGVVHLEGRCLEFGWCRGRRLCACDVLQRTGKGGCWSVSYHPATMQEGSTLEAIKRWYCVGLPLRTLSVPISSSVVWDPLEKVLHHRGRDGHGQYAQWKRVGLNEIKAHKTGGSGWLVSMVRVDHQQYCLWVCPVSELTLNSIRLGRRL